MSLDFWFMFPTATVIGMIAMASGVEGATFFAPLFMIGLGLPAEIAISTGLITEVFGFTSGLVAYSRSGLIDYKLARNLLVASVPMAILGTVLASVIPSDLLKVILGVGLVAVAMSFLRSPTTEDVRRADRSIIRDQPSNQPETVLTASYGITYTYTVCNRAVGRITAGIGGMFMGMLSTGLGELNGYFLLQRCRVPSPVAVATSVLVVAVTALSASAGHVIKLANTGGDTLDTVLSLVVFTVPGVIIGGQIGPLLSTRISQHILERILAFLFLGVAALLVGQVVLERAQAA